VKLKKFKDYSLAYSKDPKNFEKRVGLACPKGSGIDVFEKIKTPFEIKSTSAETPIILWNGFTFTTDTLNENHLNYFNVSELPSDSNLLNDFKHEGFVPKSVTNRREVKGLKFPITGISDDFKEDFKTYGKFKKSEKNFSKFQEKILPNTRFDVLAFKNSPIHVQERINGLGFDVDMGRFDHMDSINNIVEKLSKKYSPEFYQICLLEANGKLYLESITRSSNLSPSQSAKMYESAYENYYASKLPSWFKNSIFETYVQPYYKARAYDALLIKPKNSIDFKKYLNS
jgi:hypothetical protein